MQAPQDPSSNDLGPSIASFDSKNSGYQGTDSEAATQKSGVESEHDPHPYSKDLKYEDSFNSQSAEDEASTKPLPAKPEQNAPPPVPELASGKPFTATPDQKIKREEVAKRRIEVEWLNDQMDPPGEPARGYLKLKYDNLAGYHRQLTGNEPDEDDQKILWKLARVIRVLNAGPNRIISNKVAWTVLHNNRKSFTLPA